MLDEQGLGDFIGAHYRAEGDRLFRMELLPLYNVPHQAAELERWRAGATEPDWKTKQPWLDVLADEHERGLISRRVRRLSRVLTDDELMACHFGYAYNSRYEDIRVLHEGEHPMPELLGHDYWLIEPRGGDRQVVKMHYDDDGRFVGAEVLSPDQHAAYIQERDRTWAVAEAFPAWWDRHRELHRTRVA
jgi:hypothetical protein